MRRVWRAKAKCSGQTWELRARILKFHFWRPASILVWILRNFPNLKGFFHLFQHYLMNTYYGLSAQNVEFKRRCPWPEGPTIRAVWTQRSTYGGYVYDEVILSGRLNGSESHLLMPFKVLFTKWTGFLTYSFQNRAETGISNAAASSFFNYLPYQAKTVVFILAIHWDHLQSF